MPHVDKSLGMVVMVVVMMMISMRWICGSGRPHRIFTNQENRFLLPDSIKPQKAYYVKKNCVGQ
jgi:hypothetical protein